MANRPVRIYTDFWLDFPKSNMISSINQCWQAYTMHTHQLSPSLSLVAGFLVILVSIQLELDICCILYWYQWFSLLHSHVVYFTKSLSALWASTQVQNLLKLRGCPIYGTKSMAMEKNGWSNYTPSTVILSKRHQVNWASPLVMPGKTSMGIAQEARLNISLSATSFMATDLRFRTLYTPMMWTTPDIDAISHTLFRIEH